MPQTEKQQQAIKKYWDDMKKEFEESSETNWHKFLRDKNEAITKDIMMTFDLVEKNPTHYIYKCACGSILKKRYNHITEDGQIYGARNTGLKSHLKSKKHIDYMNNKDMLSKYKMVSMEEGKCLCGKQMPCKCDEKFGINNKGETKPKCLGEDRIGCPFGSGVFDGDCC